MENKEEIIEELNDSVGDETMTFEPTNTDGSNNVEEQSYDYMVDYGMSTKKKIGIVILVFLLVLDIAALVIYIIGIDKVLSFIK